MSTPAPRPLDHVPRRLILKSILSPGDAVMLTAAVRDLHIAHPGHFVTDVRTSVREIWENNPYITPLVDGDEHVETIDMHYPLIRKCNSAPYHFIHGYSQFLEEALGLRIPVSQFKGDIHLTVEEKRWRSQVQEFGFDGELWIIVAGGKYDFTTKWWNPPSYQKVVDHFKGRILFVQCGAEGHWHPPLGNVLNLVGRTTARQLIRLIYHADGVVCPITWAMHLAAAIETKPGKPKNRACVVVGGEREPPHWEAYPHHQYITTIGSLDCCEQVGCWKSRCQQVGDGDAKGNDLRKYPGQIDAGLRIPRCMEMISAEDVIRRIEMYYDGGARTLGKSKPSC